jgi:hypothetical protein
VKATRKTCVAIRVAGTVAAISVVTGCGAQHPRRQQEVAKPPTAPPVGSAGTVVPSTAAAVVGGLTSQDPAVVRANVAPEVAAAAPSSPAFPAGSRLEVDSSSWRVAGDYANLTATLTGVEAPKRYEVGLVRIGDGWRMLFTERLP